jgi:hypothetical protein
MRMTFRRWDSLIVLLAAGICGWLGWRFVAAQAVQRPYNRPLTPEDVRGVGRWKALGYIDRATLESFGEDLWTLRAELEARGLSTFIREPELNPTQRAWLATSGIAITPHLWAWDRAMLACLLTEHAHTLLRTGWPLEPELFVQRVRRETARDPEL